MAGGLYIKSKGGAAFVAAWRELCKTTRTPHFRDVFQDLSADLIPRLMLLEWAPGDKYIIRFMGTQRAEMWGVDLTGKDSIELMPNTASAARANLATMINHPCGMYHIAQYTTPTGRDIEMENITFPVANDPDLPRRLFNFADETATVAYTDPVGEVRSVSKRVWIDIGAGLPAKSPQK